MIKQDDIKKLKAGSVFFQFSPMRFYMVTDIEYNQKNLFVSGTHDRYKYKQIVKTVNKKPVLSEAWACLNVYDDRQNTLNRDYEDLYIL